MQNSRRLHHRQILPLFDIDVSTPPTPPPPLTTASIARYRTETFKMTPPPPPRALLERQRGTAHTIQYFIKAQPRLVRI
jgi:hypothetical protein